MARAPGELHIEHLDGPIWKLRPLRDRILFAAWVGGGFVLLHAFVKKTQKTTRSSHRRPVAFFPFEDGG